MNITELDVFCEEKVDSGGWLVIQRRRRFSQNFNRKWSDYKKGFGDLTGDYWFGLEKLHALTSSCEQELYIEVERINGAVDNLNGHDGDNVEFISPNGDNVEFISPKKMISDISVTLAQMMIRPTENCFRRLALSNLN
ncbi:fibrinogen C domain-containing protein 1 [Zeugodacus cucurbitae]|uniref:fibrinogen C domain-containing protein 1 n=1 Tax=Zeugodacus cucurbitae TaxID=28588 RepID=UPI0023D94BFF|nr:fibrinogen C domain-containing protein 1 [Zeugodacus cucurbitae]